MSLMQRDDFNGRIATRAKLANEPGLTVREMISTITRGNIGISEYFSTKRGRNVEPIHKSMLDDFQL